MITAGWSKALARMVLTVVAVGGCSGGGGGPGEGTLPEGALDLALNSLNPSDIHEGAVDKDENIGNQSGDPWGGFLGEMRDRCGGDPAGFSVSSGTVSVGEIDGASGLEEIFTSGMDLFFRNTQGSDEDAETVVVATASTVSGSGPVSLDGTATRDDLAVIHDRLLGGDFHVGVRGGTGLTDEDDFSVDLRMTV